MNELYLYHHLGLGDHIICSSIVRHYSKLYDKVYIFAKSHNYQSVKFMFRDLNNVDIIEGDDYVADQTTRNKSNVVKVGFGQLDVINKHFDQSFYNQIGLDFNKRWDDFYVDRDHDREKKLFDIFNIKEKDYIFVHDDRERNKVANVITNYQIIKPKWGLTDVIFDYLYLIENAKEIHCVDSSFKNLIDSIDSINCDGFYMYPTYNQPENYYPITKKNWIRV